MTRDEAVSARIAALKLERLYNAYRATSRANAMALTRVSAELERRERDLLRRERLRQRIADELGVSRQNDLVFRDRAEQIGRRIAELDRFEGS
jgi:hypothetical protein